VKGFGWNPLPSDRPESSRWMVGNRFPQSEEGDEGEWFLDLSRSTIHRKRGGLWREVERVNAGSGSWDWGRGVPAPADGAPGDVYLDTSTGRVHRKGEGWRPLTRLGGAPAPAPAAAGTAFTLGTSAPRPGDGAPGDLHLDTSTGRLYQRVTAGWRKAFTFGTPPPPPPEETP
jgi:hypothetical protein